MAWERWQALSPQEKERYKRQARDYADRGRQMLQNYRGGGGPKRTPALTAKYATEFNIPFVDVDTLRAQYGRVAKALADAGRAPESLTYSAAFVLCAGRDDAADAHEETTDSHHL